MKGGRYHMDIFNQYITKAQTKWHEFVASYSDIHINLWIVWVIAIVFVALHYLRRYPIIKNVSILMSFIPVLVHELGHAVTTTLTRGRVNDIHIMLTDYGQQKTGAQGLAKTQPRGWLSNILVTFMGYVFPPLFLFLGFWLVERGQSYLYIAILLVLGIYYLIHSKQKWLPLLIIAILFYTGFEIKVSDTGVMVGIVHFGYSVMLGLLLGETIQSIIITTRIIFSRQPTEWDGSALKDSTMIPATVWWGVWTFISVFFIIKSIL